MIEKISWLGHSSVKIGGDKIIYIDPWKLEDGKKRILSWLATVIVITCLQKI